MFKTLSISLIATLFMVAPAMTYAEPPTNSVVGVQGYDLVSFQNGKKPLQGDGNHLVTHENVHYLFINDANKQAFQANPEKYLPAYGGWCAYGVSVGKKFIGDPTVWRIINGKLYLNLDSKIQDTWLKDVPGNIKKADEHWKKIKNTPMDQL